MAMKKIKHIRQSIIWVITIMLCHGIAFAQKEERKNIRQGNSLFEDEKYTESEIAYRKGLEVNSHSIEGLFNLGNALYKQEKFKEAGEQYKLLSGQIDRMLKEDPKNVGRVSQIFHNIGNVGMKEKDYATSVEAYKMSLRMNPTDDETRYNLALAQKLLQDQQNQNQDQDQDNQDDQDKKEEQEKNDQQQNQDQQQQDEQKEDESQDQQQQDEQMSKDNAQRMLDAFLQDEKDTQEKVKKAQMQQQQRRQTDKQW
jgi:AAA ATPase containing von Willebrand factor type A (vWA) domain